MRSVIVIRSSLHTILSLIMNAYKNTERSVCTAEDRIFAQISGCLQQADLVHVDAQLALGAVENAEDDVH